MKKILVTGGTVFVSKYVAEYFASTNYPYAPSDIHFKNCVIENARNIVYNPVGHDFLHSGTTLKDLTFENVKITDLKSNSPSGVFPCSQSPCGCSRSTPLSLPPSLNGIIIKYFLAAVLFFSA